MKNIFLMLLLSGLLLSCKSVAPKSYYLLESQNSPALSASALATELIGVGPIELVGYLDRPQVTYQRRDDGVELSSHHLWAEPLKQGVARMLAADIIAHAPERAVVYFPWRHDSQPSRSVRVQLQGMVRNDTGLSLQATWVLVGSDGTEAMQYHHFNRQLSLATERDTSMQNVVVTISALLALLAEEINEQLDRTVAN